MLTITARAGFQPYYQHFRVLLCPSRLRPSPSVLDRGARSNGPEAEPVQHHLCCHRDLGCQSVHLFLHLKSHKGHVPPNGIYSIRPHDCDDPWESRSEHHLGHTSEAAPEALGS
jgi:hypothetical protein